MDKLTSLDYAELLKFAVYKFHRAILNKTQLNKILFYAYGIYLAETGKPLFDDDQPKAWPYGPVFPKVNRLVKPDIVPEGFSPDIVSLFQSDPVAMQAIKDAANKLYNKSAFKLTQWSHKEGSPWHQTIYPDDAQCRPWDTIIDNGLIQAYFSIENNRDVR